MLTGRNDSKMESQIRNKMRIKENAKYADSLSRKNSHYLLVGLSQTDLAFDFSYRITIWQHIGSLQSHGHFRKNSVYITMALQ